MRKRKLGRGVAVVGVGITKFGVYPKGVRAPDLFVEAFNEMKRSVDKGVGDEDIEAFYIGNFSSDIFEKQVHCAATDKGDCWYMFDTALAMQNLALAAHSLGLGTVHVGLFNAKRVADILAVPQGFEVVEMTPLGYPAEEPRVRPRKELFEIVFRDKYGCR